MFQLLEDRENPILGSHSQIDYAEPVTRARAVAPDLAGLTTQISHLTAVTDVYNHCGYRIKLANYELPLAITFMTLSQLTELAASYMYIDGQWGFLKSTEQAAINSTTRHRLQQLDQRATEETLFVIKGAIRDLLARGQGVPFDIVTLKQLGEAFKGLDKLHLIRTQFRAAGSRWSRLPGDLIRHYLVPYLTAGFQ